MNISDKILDIVQEKLVKILNDILARVNSISQYNIINKLYHNLFDKKHSQFSNNIYIYGGVGRGKTMLMKDFFNKLLVPKLFIHYQDFIRNIHQEIHESPIKEKKDILVHIAANVAKEYKYICIDEFEVNDIADAMIMDRLFNLMLSKKINIAITSNKAPDDLYKHGLQREQFLPFIKMVKNQFITYFCDNHHDYRLNYIESINERVIFPLSEINQAKIQDIKSKLTNNENYITKNLIIFGRELTFEKTHKSVLVLSFDELSENHWGSNDFLTIAENFEIVILENVSYIQDNETDKIIRFINLIDHLYFNKVLLFISLIDHPASIYTKGKKLPEFERTVSRLYEMNSYQYLISSKSNT